MVEAPTKRLHHVSFTLRPGTLDSVREALERAGTPVIAPHRAPARACGCAIPTATRCNCSTRRRHPAAGRRGADQPGRQPAADRGAQWQQVTDDVLPRRLGHSLLFTPSSSR